MVVVMLPFSKRLLQFIQCFEFVYPQQILLEGTDHALRVRVALRVAVACEDVLETEGLLVLRERLRRRLAAVVADNRRNQQIRVGTVDPVGELHVHGLVHGPYPVGRPAGRGGLQREELLAPPVEDDMHIGPPLRGPGPGHVRPPHRVGHVRDRLARLRLPSGAKGRVARDSQAVVLHQPGYALVVDTPVDIFLQVCRDPSDAP